MKKSISGTKEMLYALVDEYGEKTVLEVIEDLEKKSDQEYSDYLKTVSDPRD